MSCSISILAMPGSTMWDMTFTLEEPWAPGNSGRRSTFLAMSPGWRRWAWAGAASAATHKAAIRIRTTTSRLTVREVRGLGALGPLDVAADGRFLIRAHLLSGQQRVDGLPEIL